LINNDLSVIKAWAERWLISINAKKAVALLFSRKKQPSVLPVIKLGNASLSLVEEHKHLGVTLAKI